MPHNATKLSEPEQERLSRYITDNGRTWRSKLRTTWMHGAETLRETRNTYGPTGLDQITFRAGTLMERLQIGHREIVSADWLDSITDHPAANTIRTCRNRKQIGTKDQYVAWIKDTSKPLDLEFHEGHAIGSR